MVQEYVVTRQYNATVRDSNFTAGQDERTQSWTSCVRFPWEEWPQFYAIFGFVACVVLVLIAKYILRPLVMREEDYYDN